MVSKTVGTSVDITPQALMDLIRAFGLGKWDLQNFSLWDAESLEQAARLIREAVKGK